MNKILPLCLASALFGSSSFADFTFSENFSGYTVDERPDLSASFPIANPSPNNLADLGFVVREAAGASESRALQIFDYNGSGSVSLERNIASSSGTQVSDLRLDFTFQRMVAADPADAAHGLYISIGSFNESRSLHLGGNRMMDFRLYNDGTYRIGGQNILTGNYDTNIAFNEVSIFANSDSSSLDYHFGGDNYTLAAKTYDIFLNGTLVAAGRTLSGASADNSFGKFGFLSGGGVAAVDIDFLIGDVAVSPIPEPGTYALFAGLAVLVAILIRRRRRVA